MKKIVFKTGQELKISQEEANLLTDKIVEGCGRFQIFSKGEPDEVYLMINITEILYIVDL